MVKNMEQGFNPTPNTEEEILRMDDTAHDQSALYHFSEPTIGQDGRIKRKLVWDVHAMPAATIERVAIPGAIQDDERANKASRVFVESALRDFDEQSAAFDAEMAGLEATYTRQMSEFKHLEAASGTPEMATGDNDNDSMAPYTERVNEMMAEIWRRIEEEDVAAKQMYGAPEDLASARHSLTPANGVNNIKPFDAWANGTGDSSSYDQYGVVLAAHGVRKPMPVQTSIPQPGAEKVGSPADNNSAVRHTHGRDSEPTPVTFLPTSTFSADPTKVVIPRARPTSSPRTGGTVTRTPLPKSKNGNRMTTAGRGNFLQRHRGKLLALGGVAMAVATGLGIWAAMGGNDSESAKPKVEAYAADKTFTPQELNDTVKNPTIYESYTYELGNPEAGMASLTHDVDAAIAAKAIEKVYPGGYDNYGDPLWYPKEYGKDVSFDTTSKATIIPILAHQTGSEVKVVGADQVK